MKFLMSLYIFLFTKNKVQIASSIDLFYFLGEYRMRNLEHMFMFFREISFISRYEVLKIRLF